MTTNILALDLANKLGFALHVRGITRSGSMSFAPKPREHAGQRWINFRAWLTETSRDVDLSAVYIEQPIQFGPHSGQTTLVLGGYRAIAEAWAANRNVQIIEVNIGTIKRHWTGKGNAKKADMLRVFHERGIRIQDDNEADALALLDYAMCEQGQATPTAIELASEPPAVADFEPFAKCATAKMAEALNDVKFGSGKVFIMPKA